MEINILHLYPDLMNLYGEYANVVILKKHFEDQGFKTNIDKLTISDDLDISKYDFVYIGCGTEKNQLVVASHLLKYADNIKEAIDNKVVLLATGNAQELFGENITDIDGEIYETLNILPIKTKRLKERICTDIIYDCNFIDAKVVGFINKMSNISNNKYPLFTVVFGKGSNDIENTEGFKYINLYGTYVIGPIFARNPKFLKQIMLDILDNKESRVCLKDIQYPYEENGYKIVYDELLKRKNKG